MVDNAWHKHSSGAVQEFRSSDKNTLLFQLLRQHRNAELYHRDFDSKANAFYRVVYTENSVQKETFFNRNGEYVRGDKPNLNMPSYDRNPDTVSGLYEQMQKDPTNILLNKEQMSAIQRKYASKPLGKFLQEVSRPRIWIQLGGTTPIYRIVANSYRRNSSNPLAYDATFSFSGDVIHVNDDRIIGWTTKEKQFESGTKRLLAKKNTQHIPTTKQR